METYHFQEQGKRSNQEDYYYIDPINGLFLVCDGVGGATKGEVASRFVGETIARYVQEGHRPFNKTLGEEIIQMAQQELINRVKIYQDETGMATTLAMVFFHDKQATLAHVGDSRIYLYSAQNDSIWHSKDHSLVQELFDTGILKSEKEKNSHPLRNQITRALQAIPDAALVEAEVSIVDVHPGDIVLLCTDGVLEPFSNDPFEALIFNKEIPVKVRMNQLREDCRKKSTDNATCIAIEII